MKQTLQAYIALMRLDKPIGTLLLMWPTMWALWLAGQPSLPVVVVFVVGVFVMRAAGCVVNDFADRNVDGFVARTRARPLVSQRLTTKQAKILFLVLCLLALLLVLTLNRLSIILSIFALLTAIIYPFMKRYTHLPQLVLALAFSWGIPMAYAATIASFPLTCWLLCLANMCWTIAYDTQYAMVDRADDLKIGIKSTAILFGQQDKLIIGLLQIATLLLFVIIAQLNDMGRVFYPFLIMAGLLFIYQHYLIWQRDPARCFNAFLNNNYVGLLLFIGILAHFYLATL